MAYFVIIFIYINLWNYIYDDPTQLINGYSKAQMIWYVIFTEIIYFSLGGRRACIKLAEEVKSGRIAYTINKPYNYVLYSLCSHMGNVFIKSIVFLLVGLLMGAIFIGEFPVLSFVNVLALLVIFYIALIVNTLFIIVIGLFSFIIEDSVPMYWLYSKFTLICGALFPIEFFPAIVARILKYSPIVALSYGPGRLFVNFSYDLAWKIILAQIIYIIVFYIIAKIIYKKGVKKLNVNGG
jgi:ABC-2 type transport system permease protein